MSLRKAKLLLETKRKIEQKQVEQVKDVVEEQEVVESKRDNIFDAFGNSDEDEEETVEIEEKPQNSKQSAGKKKKKPKENKKKQLAELQEALAQINREADKIEKTQKGFTVESRLWEELLSIHEGKFNYEKELKRHFKDYEKEKEEEGKKEKKLMKNLMKMQKKSILLPSLANFTPIRQKFELQRGTYVATQDDTLDRLEKAFLQDFIRFIPTKRYEHYQIEYEAMRNTNDVNALFDFMQTHPEHVDALYSGGQFLRLRGDYQAADKLLQNVIYIFEMSGGYEFLSFVKEDYPRKAIFYDVISTSLFMSLFKYIDILGKKGCYRAALQFNKLLLKLNNRDPSASLLCIDYNAISAKLYGYIISFIEQYSHYLEMPKHSIYLMPNFTYSYALAKFHLEIQLHAKQLVVHSIESMLQFTPEQWKSALLLSAQIKEEHPNTLLLRAIMVYPRLILDIASKTEYSKQMLNHPCFVENQKKTFQQILSHAFWADTPNSYSYHFLRLQSVEDSNGLDKVLDVYVERSKILWKANNVMLWVKAAMGYILNQVENGFNYQQYLESLCLEECQAKPIPFRLKRYAQVSKANFTDRVERIDLNNIQDNQQVARPPQGRELDMQGNLFQVFMNSLLPWVNLPTDPNQPQIEED